MIRSVFVLAICIVTVFLSSAQETLKGKVIASDTQKPIPVANVFLSNTSVGTITDENGAFVIQRFPAGRYELVISCIGYETSIVTIYSEHLPDNLLVRLKPKVDELQEVIVEPYEKNGWEKYGAFFTENFIGTSVNAQQCQLRNKDIVKFRFSKKQNTLKAFADEPLVLENKALGYSVKYTLNKFEYNYTTGIFFYQGYPLFTELETKSKRTRRKWAENRENSYYGSIMHFMRSLYRNKLKEQKFEVRKMITVSEAEKKRVKTLYQNQVKKLSYESKVINMEGNMGFASADSLNYYRRVMFHPEQLNIIVDTLLTGDSIAYAVNRTTLALQFEDHLQIIYPPKKNPPEFARKYTTSGGANGAVTAELVLTSERPIIILANGSYFEGLDLLTSGYWGWWEKLGNMLPYDYWPPPKK